MKKMFTMLMMAMMAMMTFTSCEDEMIADTLEGYLHILGWPYLRCHLY